MKLAIARFQEKSSMTPTGEATEGVLTRLRKMDDLKPWGSIVFNPDTRKWGISWKQSSRRAAVEDARAKCAGAKCEVELTPMRVDGGVRDPGGDVGDLADIRHVVRVGLAEEDDIMASFRQRPHEVEELPREVLMDDDEPHGPCSDARISVGAAEPSWGSRQAGPVV